MFNAYHLYGGSAVLLKLKTGATITAGQPTLNDTASEIGELIPATTTSALAGYGVALDTATHSTTLNDPEGVVTVDCRDDRIIRARLSGSATAGTDLTVLTETTGDATGLTVSSGDVLGAEMDSGLIWRVNPGGQSGDSRVINADTDATSVVVVVPFTGGIAVGEQYIAIPSSRCGVGAGNVQATTDIQEVDATIVSGTGIVVAIVRNLNFGASDSFIDFKLTDHALADDVLA